MLDIVAAFFLLFSNAVVIIPFLILGFIWLDKSLFYHAICLILISSLINVALKVSFQIPLPASIAKNWFAFPSGHMQMTTVLYGWIAYKIGIEWIKRVLITLLIGIALSLIHFNYHNVYDIIGALFFALLILVLYPILYSKWPTAMPWILLITAINLIAYIHLRYRPIPNHAWVAFFMLVGFIIAETLSKGRHILLSIKQKLIATLLVIVLMILTYSVFQIPAVHTLPFYFAYMEWLIIGFILPWSCLIAKWIKPSSVF
ncbi:phosphatase PAP2 family protein [Legionella hackeliae]|uniref:Phosphatidic acid phosphatase type 2/haloperoxidase domain-containing protein n=1 Tax=Legionella hackeliae TaxID=449 RepID=A0A0A8UX08_LEGHA|nr:phosphatase PAP2 family protein [Legionella hackeliae]KTD12650.1 PAP2 superfamily protein [Legionella hackeliae]CEK12066.1 membrane protein of unknown function [Legionella hackeliae]STX48854.1 PAP2 superfamily [Legionella hackeliae]